MSVHISMKDLQQLTGRKPVRKKRRTKAEWLEKFSATPARPYRTAEEFASQRSLFEKHDTAVIDLRLPLPPSVNNYRAIFHNRMITSAEGRAYHEAVDRAWLAHNGDERPEPLTGRLRLLIEVVFPTRAGTDLDNRVKPLQDAMKAAGVYVDDCLIDDVRVRRGAVCSPGWVDVIIEVTHQ